MDEPKPATTVPSVSAEQVQAHRMAVLGALAPGVLHDLNNPLAAIQGFSELLRRDPRLPEDMRQQAGLLVDEAARLRRIVQATFDFIRVRPPERHPTGVRALIDAALVLVAYRLSSSGVELDLDIPDDLPPVEVDRAQILQVLLALAQASLDALGQNGSAGRLLVDARREGLRLRLSVGHDGPRGPVPDLRVPAALVAEHGGDLRALPGIRGRGTTFTFTLPVDAAALAPRPRAMGVLEDVMAHVAVPEPTEAPRRILVLDDERSIRLLLEKWLRGAGFEPVVAERGEEAVELVREAPFDAILCDHRMAGMNGTEVFEAVVALRPELRSRFVFMSGDILNPQLRDFIAEHGVGLLPKPFDLGTVRTTLESVLD